jgi:hypothetical protein
VTGKVIERGPKLDDLKIRVRDCFRGAERGKLSHLLQVKGKEGKFIHVAH